MLPLVAVAAVTLLLVPVEVEALIAGILVEGELVDVPVARATLDHAQGKLDCSS